MNASQTWQQTYYLFGHGIGFSAALAALPILAVLLILGVFRKAAWVAGLSGLAAAFVVALGFYHMPAGLAFNSALLGATFGLFPIMWIVFWAIMLFRLTVETGKFAIIKDSVGRLTDDPRLQAILIGFAFGAFIEGAAGFGTPVAITAAMLTGLGFSAFRASAFCLLANTAPVAFGSIGIPVITLGIITGIDPKLLSAEVGRLCAPISIITPMYLMAAIGGTSTLAAVWLPALVAGIVFGCVQFFVSNFIGPQLTDILASIAAMAALVITYKVWKPRASKQSLSGFFGTEGAPTVSETIVTLEENLESLEAEDAVATSRGAVFYAWLPYIYLVICVLLWGYPPFHALLDKATVILPWPGLHNLVLRSAPIVAKPTPYAALFKLDYLGASGTSCMLATLLGAITLRVKPAQFLNILGSVTLQLALPILTVASVLAMAFLMNYSGATATLGLAFAAGGAAFPFFSALLGWIGVFLTGSDTSSNALFGTLQVVTANRLGLNPVLIAATNSAGGVMGKMISLQNIAVAAAATGISVSDQARLFRFTLKHSILLAALIGCLSLLYAHVLHI